MAVKKEIENIGSKCLYVKADLAEVDDCRNVIASTEKLFGTVHSLVNVAGFTERGTIVSTTLDNYEKCFNVNTRAPFLLMQESIKIMRRDKVKGTIAHVLSMAAHSGMPFLTAYSASKGGVVALTLPAARELAQFGIRVVTVAPGLIGTPMLHAMPEEVQTSLANQVPFPRRLGDADEFAALVEHIIDNELLNGEVIRLDGAIRMNPT